jgi:murein DD-endopeptidase MepM/ murein hydrolase activator NlpD
MRQIPFFLNDKKQVVTKTLKTLESQLGLVTIVVFALVMNLSIASAKSTENLSDKSNQVQVSQESLTKTSEIIAKFTPNVALAANIDTPPTIEVKPTPVEEPVLPRTEAISYTVQSGDVLSSIANRYSLNTDTLQFTNKLTSANNLKVGQVLTIPVNNMSAAAIAKAKSKLLAYAPRTTLGRDTAVTGVFSNFIVPLKSYSMISQRFGGSHKGIDYATPVGTRVYATADGVVIEAKSFGWNGGWGKTILIKHGNGITSRYGHLSEVDVEVGQTVGQGEFIGKTGNTGHSTGPHLHFQKEINGRAVYPYN